MLAVVEDEDCSAAVEHRGHARQRVGGVGARRLVETERPLHDRDDIALVVRDCEFGEPNPIGRVRLQPTCDLQRQPGLADASRAGERDQAPRANRVVEPIHLIVATDQGTDRMAEVAPPPKAGADRLPVAIGAPSTATSS